MFTEVPFWNSLIGREIAFDLGASLMNVECGAN